MTKIYPKGNNVFNNGAVSKKKRRDESCANELCESVRGVCSIDHRSRPYLYDTTTETKNLNDPKTLVFRSRANDSNNSEIVPHIWDVGSTTLLWPYEVRVYDKYANTNTLRLYH